MPESSTALRHADADKKDDHVLVEEARTHVSKSPALQLIAELVRKLRASTFSWWTPDVVRESWGAAVRMEWFAHRPDLRQKITTGLTGLAPKAARNKTPLFQAELIDSVIEDGDVTVKQFDDAFDPADVAAYAPVVEVWQRFRERMPWEQDTPAHQELVAWLLEALLASQSSLDGVTRKPILTAHAVRTTIPGKIWHTRIPLEVRVAIDDLRFQREKVKPTDPFHSSHDLSVATPAIIAANIPLRELTRILDVAERAMAFPAYVPPRGGSVARGGDKPAPSPEPRAEVKGDAHGNHPTTPPGADDATLATRGPALPGAPATTARAGGGDEDFAFDDDDDGKKSREAGTQLSGKR